MVNRRLFSHIAPHAALSLATSAAIAALSLGASPLLVGCGSSTPAATNQNMAAGQCPPGAAPGYPGCAPTAAQGYPTAAGGAPTAPGAYPPAPAPYPTAPAPGGYPTATAAPTAPPPAMPDVADAAIKLLAMQQAPGMQPEGARLNLSVMEGKDASSSVSLVGGKCYTFIGVGQGVMALEMQLSLPLVTTPVSSDSSPTPNATIGKGSTSICPMTPFPIPYTLRVIARKGSGNVAVQVFSKIK